MQSAAVVLPLKPQMSAPTIGMPSILKFRIPAEQVEKEDLAGEKGSKGGAIQRRRWKKREKEEEGGDLQAAQLAQSGAIG